MPKAKPKQSNDWSKLIRLINEIIACARADEVKGGGDPLDVPLIEKELELAEVKLRMHIEKMQRELES